MYKVRSQSPKKEPEVVVFHSRRNNSNTQKTNDKPKPSKETNNKNDKATPAKRKSSESENAEEFSMKKARFDVYKFGIKGLNKEEQENAKMQLAIKLGAKPPKNKYENYKEILKRKTEEKNKKLELINENRLFETKLVQAKPLVSFDNKNKNDKSRVNRKAKISKGNVGQIKGHIGSFSNGILKLSKFDLKKMSNKKKSK